MRTLVTGGGGFLGSHLVERLRARRHESSSPARADYDLTTWDDAERLFARRAGACLPPRGEVGGIGANRANPGGTGTRT
jgi:GDP-L-fucose synthase